MDSQRTEYQVRVRQGESGKWVFGARWDDRASAEKEMAEWPGLATGACAELWRVPWACPVNCEGSSLLVRNWLGKRGWFPDPMVSE